MSKERDVRCDLCNVSTPTIVDQINHDASLIHHMKLDHYHKGNWMHVCGICNTSTGTLKSFINHLKGRKHEINYAKEKPKWSSKSSYKIPPSFFLKPKPNDVNSEILGLNVSPSSSNMKPQSRATNSKIPKTTNVFHNTSDMSNYNKEKSNNCFSNQPWMTVQNYAPQPWGHQASTRGTYEWNVQSLHESNPQNRTCFWENWSEPQYNNYQNNWNPHNEWYPSNDRNTNNNWGMNPIMHPDFGAEGYSQNFNGIPNINSKNFKGPLGQNPKKFNSAPQNPQKFNVTQQNKFNVGSLQQKKTNNILVLPTTNQPQHSGTDIQEEMKESISKEIKESSSIENRESRSISKEIIGSTLKESRESRSTSQETKEARSTSQDKEAKSTSKETRESIPTLKETRESRSTSQETRESRSTSQETRESRFTSKETRESRSTWKETRESVSTLKETGGCRSTSKDTGEYRSTSKETGECRSTLTETEGSWSTSKEAGGSRCTSKETGGSRSTSKETGGSRSTSKETGGSRSTSNQTGGSRSTSNQTGGSRSTSNQTGGSRSTSKETGGSRSTSKETGGSRSMSKETRGSRSTSKETGGSRWKDTLDSTGSQKSNKLRERIPFSHNFREKEQESSPKSKFKVRQENVHKKSMPSKCIKDGPSKFQCNKDKSYKSKILQRVETKRNNDSKEDKKKEVIFKKDDKKWVLQRGNESNSIKRTCIEPMDDSIPKCSSKSSTDSTCHLYFLSSDSDGEDDFSSNSKNKTDQSLSNLNKKNEGNKSFNKILINRLVNHPCTPRQQLQLTRWLQSQDKSRKVSMPRFNLPLNEQENAIENVMNELPDDILTSLYRAIENDDLTQPEMEVCLKTEAIDDNSGNIPWADFLKSLEENGNILDPMVQDKEEENLNGKQTNEGSSVRPSLNPEEPVRIKQEPNTDKENVTVSQNHVENVPNNNSTIEVKIEPIDTELPTTTNLKDHHKPIVPLNRCISPSGIDSPSSTHRPPSIGSGNPTDQISFYQSQKEVNEWISRLNSEVPECITIPTTPPRPGSENGSTRGPILVPSKDLVDDLLRLNSQEELLRDQSQKVEQVISQLYRLLEEWKMKRNEIILQETNFRNRRMKLLENLKGAFRNGNPAEVPITPEAASTYLPKMSDMNNMAYMDTLDSTLDFVNELGNDLGLNVSQVSSTNLLEEDTMYPLPDSSNLESSPSVMKKGTKTKKVKKKKDCNLMSLASTSKMKTKNMAEVEPTKKKKKRKSETEISSTSTIVEKKRKKYTSKSSKPSQEEIDQASMMRDYMSTVMPEHLGTEISDPCITSPTSETAELNDDEDQNNIVEEKIFEPLKIHQNAVIDLKVMKGFLYSCSSDKMAKRIDLKDCTQIITYEGHEKTVSSIQVYKPQDSNITLVFTSCHDCFLRCFNADTGHSIDKIDLSSPIVSMTLRWEMLFLGLQNGKIVPYDITNSKLLEPILGSNEVSISYICAASEGCQRLLFIVDYKGAVAVRNANTGLFIRSLEGTVKPPCRITVHSLSVYITTMAKTILIYDLMTGALQRKIISGSSSATGISFIRDKAICCYLDGTIKCYNKTTWKLLCIFYNPDKPMTMCMEIKDNWIYTGNRFGSIQGFKLDFSSMKPCKYQKCHFPLFGREDDLRKHMEAMHMNKTELNNVKICPWKSCTVDLSSTSVQTKKCHILCHASK